MEVARSKEGIVINKMKYILDLKSETGIKGCKLAETPMEANLKLRREELGSPMNKEHYQRLVGKLIYLSLTRLDIAFPVSIVSQYMSDPIEEHLEVVNRILRYLKMTPEHGLIFRKSDDREVRIFSDSSWAGELTDRRSTTGYCSFVSGILVEKEIGEKRIIAFHGVGLSVVQKIWPLETAAACKMSEEISYIHIHLVSDSLPHYGFENK
ncbi:secreted RxLR effector protein 161-like [Hibiscus syriacus]|uniref:secreted RxLR effector protein 161-like n=1 Tax=Hibiscus syriacus TaxID=106335 RepID=UPI0019245CB6|nr:secreted RxLR effector protein 161-like [Hibiscus syriacus]